MQSAASRKAEQSPPWEGATWSGNETYQDPLATVTYQPACHLVR